MNERVFYHYKFCHGTYQESQFDEIAPDVLGMFQRFIIESLNTERPLPFPFSEYAHLSYMCKTNGIDLYLMVFAPIGPFLIGQPQLHPFLGKNLNPLYSIVISLVGDEDFFAELFETYSSIFFEPPPPPAPEMPPVPWIAELAFPAPRNLGVEGDFASMMYDMERCFAWAWLELSNEKII